MDSLRNLYPNMVMVDGGDVGISTRPNIVWQTPILWEAMQELGYDVVSLGERDCDASTFEWLQKHQSEPAFLAGNLAKTEAFAKNIAAVSRDGVKIGFVAAVSEKVMMQNPHFVPEPLEQYLAKVKPELDAKNVDFKVLLYHGNSFEARQLAKTHQEYDLILVGHSNGKPMSSEFYVDSVPIVGPGDRGRELALITLSKNAGKVKVNAEIVPLDDSVAFSPKADPYIQKAKDMASQANSSN